MKSVVFCPSNQAAKMSPWRREYSEYGGMHFLAPLIVEACRAQGLNAHWLAAYPDNDPKQPYQHAYIVAQINSANLWLDTQPGEPDDKCIIHLHTDSGDFSHTFGIFTSRFPNSERLARCYAEEVQRVLATGEVRVFERLGSIDYNGYLFATKAKYTTALAELCAHTVKQDIDNLYAHPGRVAEASAKAVLRYFGQVGTAELETLKRRNAALEEQVTVLLAQNALADTTLAKVNLKALEIAALTKG